MEHAQPIKSRRFLYPTAFRKEGLDVIWEASPADVVDEMIARVHVCASDLVYDLGCGDGRTLIAAAKERGARCVGIDLDPQRIRESCENAHEAEVDGLTRFVNADLFETDIRDATVVFLFLFPDVNFRLRPKLLRELKPGSRIVSYCHGMGRWRPDKIARRMENEIYLWVVPANMSGIWEGTVETGGDNLPLHMTMKQEFQCVSGAVFIGQKVFYVESAAMKGEAFAFADEHCPTVQTAGAGLRGYVRGDTITGTFQTDNPLEELSFVARRDPSTRMSLAQ